MFIGNGVVMFVNDMYLGLCVLNLWFCVCLCYFDVNVLNGMCDVSGVILFGMLVLVVGFNGQVVWGFINSYGDWEDWVCVQCDFVDVNCYCMFEGWEDIVVYCEMIYVKGVFDYVMMVQDMCWGLIFVCDIDGMLLVFVWIGDWQCGYNFVLMQFECVFDMVYVFDFVFMLGMLVQNLFVVDSVGYIGWIIVSNSILLCWGIDLLVLVDWLCLDIGWVGWVSVVQYLCIENLVDGWLWMVNNCIVDGVVLVLLGNGGYDLGVCVQIICDDLCMCVCFFLVDLFDIQFDICVVLFGCWQ